MADFACGKTIQFSLGELRFTSQFSLGELRFTSQFGFDVAARFTHQFELKDGIGFNFPHSFELGFLSASFPTAFHLSEEVELNCPTSFAFSNQPFSSNTRLAAALVTIRRKISGSWTSKTFPVQQVSIERSKSQPKRWSITVPNPTGEYSPWHTTSGWLDWLREETQDMTSPTRLVDISIITESGITNHTDLVIKEDSGRLDPTTGYSIQLSGIDFSAGLLEDDISITTYRGQTAKEIIIAIAVACGFKAENVVFDYPLNAYIDYPVTKMDVVKTKGINKIQALLDECGACWRVEGQRLICWMPSLSDILSPSRTFEGGSDIYVLAWNRGRQEYYNKVTVLRATQNADVVFQREGDSIGWVDGCSLSSPVYGARLTVENNVNCTVPADFIHWYRDGTYVGNGYTVSSKVTDLTFSVAESASQTMQNVYWKVKVTGTPEEYLGTGIDINAGATSSIGAGDREAPDIESPYTPSDAVALLQAKAFLREQGRARLSVDFDVPIQHCLYPDYAVDVSEDVCYFAGRFNIETIKTDINGFIGRDTITGVRYES